MGKIERSISSIEKIIEQLACPQCYSGLVSQHSSLKCTGCGREFPMERGIIDLRPQIQGPRTEVDDWTKHWSADNQQSVVQRFFSFYRQAVFARTVSYFIGKYFPDRGTFVEAGCGTSETSIRINKKGGSRLLVAVDIILPVLEHTHPVMDMCLGGDIFHLPFKDNSLDGLWNVGVMEHFTYSQIDAILGEFHRVLKPNAPLLLLWPGDNSVPQKLLRAVEAVVNLRPRQDKFRFHPDEISKLNSVKHGREILTKNGFKVLEVDFGLRSLMGFITPVGMKE